MLNKFFDIIVIKKIRMLAVVYIVFITILLVFLIMLPDQYKAKGTYAPSPELQSSSLSALAGSLGGLAGMAGINLGGNKRDNLKMALEVIKSKSFIYKLINDNDLQIQIFAAKDWDILTNKLIINSKLYDEKNQRWVRKVKPPKTIKPSDFEIYKVFKNNLSVSFDEKTKMVRVSYQHVSPVIAKKIVDLIIYSINKTIQEREMKEARTSILLLKKAIEKAQYTEMKELLYDLVQEQTKRLLLAQAREFYVFEPIDPPIVEEEKSSPKRGLILIIITFIYGMLSLMFLFFGTKNRDA